MDGSVTWTEIREREQRSPLDPHSLTSGYPTKLGTIWLLSLAYLKKMYDVQPKNAFDIILLAFSAGGVLGGTLRIAYIFRPYNVDEAYSPRAWLPRSR